MDTLKVRIHYSPDGTVSISHLQGEEQMNTVALELTIEELRLLTTLASDQIFRRQFIDPRMPGHKTNSGEMSMGKALVARLRLMLDEGKVAG
ncbi:MAG TPA: hypothetical protein VNH83_20275 [Bryobacteraceae bacterium]|nr:hypothetical protein [Bryobacteraceae bacterium]